MILLCYASGARPNYSNILLDQVHIYDSQNILTILYLTFKLGWDQPQ